MLLGERDQTDGLVLFYWVPDWRTYTFQDGLPLLKGKMALMPVPAFEPGGRRILGLHRGEILD